MKTEPNMSTNILIPAKKIPRNKESNQMQQELQRAEHQADSGQVVYFRIGALRFSNPLFYCCLIQEGKTWSKQNLQIPSGKLAHMLCLNLVPITGGVKTVIDE